MKAQTVFKELLGRTAPHYCLVRFVMLQGSIVHPHDMLIFSELDAYISLSTVYDSSAALDYVEVGSQNLERRRALLVNC